MFHEEDKRHHFHDIAAGFCGAVFCVRNVLAKLKLAAGR